LELLEDLIARQVTVHFHKESLIFNGQGDSPISMLLLQVIGAVAQFERTNMLERVTEGIAMTKIHGTKSGKPFGKQPLDMTRRDEAIDLCKLGNNISQIAKIMKLSRPSIYKLLS
jgi:DNA invertase Pin-like site-specific DNA recombinase